jgi:ubiquinone/menaquinone biosynthesis C-methylase UbiE
VASARPYFLGDHDSEILRLEYQSNAWRDITIELCADAGIGAGHRVVDLGSGPGFFTFDLASMVGSNGHVLAVDKSDDFLAALTDRAKREQRDNISILHHDIEAAPLPDVGFDFVFARWLDPYVDDLDDLISKELRCLKPAGRLISIGTFNYQGACIAPWSNEFDHVTKKIIEFYETAGRKINAGNLVPALVCAQGASILSLKDVSRLARPGDELWEWYRQFSFSMLPRLLGAGLINQEEADSYAAVWEKRTHTAGAFISVPSHVGIVAEKPHA